MSKLDIGPRPEPLTVRYVVGDPFTSALTLKQNGVEIAWPSAPVLEFESGATWTATLSTGTSVANAKATWTASEAQVSALDAAALKGVRLSVDGVTWWVGRSIRHA